MRSLIDLTDRFPMSFDVERLRTELTLVENKDWVRHYDSTQPAGWTTLVLRSIKGSLKGPDSIRHGPWAEYRNTALVEDCPYMREVIESFKCPIGRVRLSKMAAHTKINPHRDIEDEVASVAFNQVRLHIPITTSDKVVFFIGNEQFRMTPGRLYYADFAKTHSVRNDGDETRVHLFLELKMNDWLRGLFPRFTLLEKLDMAVQRIYLPLFWKLRNFWLFSKYVRAAKGAYEGSAMQTFVRWARGRGRIKTT
jgi:Aspartyl/Asparaginyl beta-hydroxylase